MKAITLIIRGIAVFTLATLCGAGMLSSYGATQREETETRLDEEAMRMVTDILARYVPWTKVTFEGKIRSSALPVSPTVKIYAENSAYLQISLRAPFLGELGRVEVRTDSCLLVNKWKKTYCLESMRHINEMYPGVLGDLQSLLLGRIVIPGSGELSLDNLGNVELRSTDNGEWLVLPREQLWGGKIRYGYVANAMGRTAAFYGMMEERPENLEIRYTYPGNSMDMQVKLHRAKTEVDVTLDYSSIRWGGTPLSPIRLSGYTRMGIYDFVRNIR